MGTLLIRADADDRMGAGHAVRCMALARAWQAAGGQATFISHCPVERIRRRIRATGAELIPVRRPHPDPNDMAATLDLLDNLLPKSETAPWVVLDGYHFDSDYQRAIRSRGGRLLVVDDMARLPHYHADLLLNQNAGAERLDYSCDPDTTLLLGANYVLLRPEFHRWKSWRRTTPELARNVLVTLGGADPRNVTSIVLHALERLDVPGYTAKVVVGPANPHLKSLREQLRDTPANVELITDVDNMSDLMARADVAVTAAGSTCWETAWMQLPAVAITTADNQEPIARRLYEIGVVTWLRQEALYDGPPRPSKRAVFPTASEGHRTKPATPGRPSAEEIATALASLCRNPERRAQQSESGRRLVDGRGAARVVAVMRALAGGFSAEQPRLRPARADDVFSLWRLKNDPAALRASLVSAEPVPLDEHVEWFQRKLASPDSLIWVLDFQGLVVAMVRYDRTAPGTGEISIAAAAAFRRQGLAARLLRETAPLARRQLHVDRLRAIVRQQNQPSAQTFTQAGFVRGESKSVENQPCYLFEQTV